MNEIDIVKTLEGATVQVSSHDNSDSDEEDGNVYNIKVTPMAIRIMKKQMLAFRSIFERIF